jgi:hypothetical protein
MGLKAVVRQIFVSIGVIRNSLQSIALVEALARSILDASVPFVAARPRDSAQSERGPAWSATALASFNVCVLLKQHGDLWMGHVIKRADLY